MAETYVVVRTVEDTLANETIVATVAAGARPKWNKAKAQTRAAELANEFKMQNNYRRVDFDCKEVKHLLYKLPLAYRIRCAQHDRLEPVPIPGLYHGI